ncbi:ABC transporter permease [Intrasporangium sp.]|uniref:ABC transporter permease n=1 Tax=Intrasporangium sp. TaxID=1925024 RepID=UPI00293B0B1E|nr:ABC transporter permease [Intrasporangium sp.]MDV3222249.1 ABC transporter permease [Intrasporangium sp.]
MTTTQPQRTDTHVGKPARRHTESVTAPWALVALREIQVRVVNRTFLVSTLLTVLFIGGFAGFQVWQASQASTHTIAVTGAQGTAIVDAAHGLARELDDKVSIRATAVDGDVGARVALEEERAEAWLHDGPSGWVLTSTDDLDLIVTTALQQAVRDEAIATNAAAAGTTYEEMTRGTELSTDRLDGGTDSDALQGATFAFALLFFFAAMTFGLQIAGSVIVEKESRLVEILATAIPLRQLLAGKVIGNSVIALAQVVLYCIIGVVALSFTDASTMLPFLTSAVGWFVAFFAVGFLAMACLYAVGGALASRNEDLQSTTSPMTMVVMLVYFASFGLSGTALQVASFVPIVSVVSMPARVLAGEAAWWEPVVALVILAGFAAGCIAIGERVYRRSLLQTGGKLTWRQGLKAVE